MLIRVRHSWGDISITERKMPTAALLMRMSSPPSRSSDKANQLFDRLGAAHIANLPQNLTPAVAEPLDGFLKGSRRAAANDGPNPFRH